jgi:hypothetical protein
MTSRLAQAPASHLYPRVLVDYRIMPLSHHIHQTNHRFVYYSEYVHVPLPRRRSHYFDLEVWITKRENMKMCLHFFLETAAS